MLAGGTGVCSALAADARLQRSNTGCGLSCVTASAEPGQDVLKKAYPSDIVQTQGVLCSLDCLAECFAILLFFSQASEARMEPSAAEQKVQVAGSGHAWRSIAKACMSATRRMPVVAVFI